MTDATPAEPSAPTDPRVARSRAKLLRAATELLVETGPRSVTVDAVVERSGVAKTTLYRQWGSREELLVDVMRSNVPDVEPPDPDAGFEEQLRSLIHAVATTISAPEWRAMLPALMSLQHQMPELRHISEADRAEKQQIMATVLGRGIDDGVLPADLDLELAAKGLVGPIVFAVVSGEIERLDELADHVVDRFIASYR